jgi:hypothetical protein
LRLVPEWQRLSIRYEELVRDPQTTLSGVAVFAGIDPAVAGRRWLEGVTFPDRNDAWREGLDPAAVATIEGVEGDDLRRHGYA